METLLNLVSVVLAPALMLVAMLIGFVALDLAKKGFPWNKKRRSPFTSQFLRVQVIQYAINTKIFVLISQAFFWE